MCDRVHSSSDGLMGKDGGLVEGPHKLPFIPLVVIGILLDCGPQFSYWLVDSVDWCKLARTFLRENIIM